MYAQIVNTMDEELTLIREAAMRAVSCDEMETLSPAGWELWNYAPGGWPMFVEKLANMDEWGNKTYLKVEVLRDRLLFWES